MRAVAVFEFIDRCAGGFREQLVAHADTHAGAHVRVGEELANVFHGLGCGVRVAGAVGEEQAVKLQLIEIVVPGHAHHFHAAPQQAADNVVLHAAVHEYYAAACALAVSDDFLARNFFHIVHPFVFRRRHIVGLVVEDDFAHHHAVFAQQFGEFSRVDARDARHVLALEPVGEAFAGIPVAVFRAVIAYDNGRGVYAVALHKVGKAVGIVGKGRYAVVAHKGIGERHQLPGIRRVGEAFGVAAHGGVEHDFACHGTFISERLSVKPRAVVKD